MSLIRRPRVLFVTMLAWALALSLTAAPGAAQSRQEVNPVLLHPGQGDLVDGPTTFHVRQPQALGEDGPYVRQLSFFDVYVDGEGQAVRQFIGYDDVGIDPNGWASRCDLFDCSVPGVWSFTWEPDPALPTGQHHIEVEPFVCPHAEGPLDQRCVATEPPHPVFEILVDLTPPDLTLQGEDEIQVFQVGAQVPLRALPAPGGDVQLVQWAYRPWQFLFGKGLPRKDQNIDGADVSGDLDGDGTTGDASCAPTAVGSSLSWFAESDEDYGDILPDGDDAAAKMKKLVEMLGEDMDTDDSGSTAAEIKKGAEDYLDGVGLGDDFDVEMDEEATSGEVSTEFARGQDVTLGLRGGGWGHFVAVERIVRLEGGGTVITVMDPWTGGLVSINVAADGKAMYKFPWQGADDDAVEVSMLMIHISPTADGAAPVNGGNFAGAGGSTSPTDPGGSTSGDEGESLMWDTTGVAPGRYLVRATATDSAGLSRRAYQTIDLVGAGPDVSVTKTAAQRGSMVDWTVTVTNDGPGDAEDVRITDTLSHGQEVADASDGCTMVDGVLACDVGAISEGESTELLITTTIDPGYPSFANTAVSRHAALDSDPTNDGDTASLLIDPAELSAVPDGIDQVTGADLTETAISMSRRRFADAEGPAFAQAAAAHVVLSRADDFPDSLAGSVLTGDAPMLFTPGAALDARTSAEIDRVLGGTGTIYLLGGVSAISETVQSALTTAGYTVMRLAGPTRIETALSVADEARRLLGDTGEVLIARDRGPDDNPTAGWADSVTGGGYAANTGTPVIVTPTGSLHPGVRAWLDADDPAAVSLLGGPAALSDDVAAALPGSRRIAGENRAATAVAVSTELWGQATEGERSHLIVNGSHEFGWAHGLSAAGLAADGDAPILLTATSSNPPETVAAVDGCVDRPVTLTGVGPTSALDPQRMVDLDALDDDECQ